MKTDKLTFKISKRLTQSWGQDRNGVFAENHDISLVNLCDAVAFLFLLRQGGCKSVDRYNPNKLRDIYKRITGTRLHTYTVERYINVLMRFDLCKREGTTIHLSKIKSQTKSRNFKIEYCKSDSIKSIGRRIAEHVVSAPMRAIAYVNELKRRLNDPKNLKELKDSKHRAKRLQFDIERFVDNGIAYSTLSSRFNVSRNYVINIVKDCIKHGIIGKVRNVVTTCFDKASKLFVNIKKFLSSVEDEYTFYYYDTINDKLRLFNVGCNHYVYNPRKTDTLGFNTCW